MPEEKPGTDKSSAPAVNDASKPTPPPPPAKPAAAAPPKPAPVPWECDLVWNLKREYGSGIREAAIYLKDKYLVVDKSIVFDVLTRMRDDQQFDYCVDITAVHWPKREEAFDVVYILYS